MSFTFDYAAFESYYTSPLRLRKGKPITMNMFKRSKNFAMTDDIFTTDLIHPYLDNIYISQNYDETYIFFNIPININGVIYSNHFSFGRKDINVKTKKPLIDVHYTVQDPMTKSSFKDNNKCFLFDGKTINIETFYSENCDIPRNKPITEVYIDPILEYLFVIISAPFLSPNNTQLQETAKRLNRITSNVKAPPSSPNPQSAEIFVGLRGGKYKIVNGKKHYVTSPKKATKNINDK